MNKSFDEKISNTCSNEAHIIDEVPYVGQQNSIFCSFACQTMILKYYNSNIELNDFLFNSGIGYSLSYDTDYIKYFPIGGTFLSQWPSDRRFVGNLYGLDVESWIPTNLSYNIYDNWKEYWKKVKDNIKNNTPVTTGVDLIYLPLSRELISDNLWVNAKKFPNFAWNLMSTPHEIVLVGFDEVKKVVYYNDPVALALGKKEKGAYASVPLNDFARSTALAKTGSFTSKFLINIYKKNKLPFNDRTIFKKAHYRNIQKLKGDPEVYDKKWQKKPLGLEALNKLIKEFEIISDKKNSNLISRYRLDSFKNALVKRFYLFFVKKSNPIINKDNFLNFYDIISIEKEQIYNYLKNKPIDMNGVNKELELLEKEIKKWKEISEFFSSFYKELMECSKKRKNQKINDKLLANVFEIKNIENSIIKFF